MYARKKHVNVAKYKKNVDKTSTSTTYTILYCAHIIFKSYRYLQYVCLCILCVFPAIALNRQKESIAEKHDLKHRLRVENADLFLSVT